MLTEFFFNVQEALDAIAPKIYLADCYFQVLTDILQQDFYQLVFNGADKEREIEELL